MNADMNKPELKAYTSRENRKIPRNACFMRGEIIISESNVIHCDIHDIAVNSARLVFPEKIKLPDRFVLHIPRRKVKEWVKVLRRGDKDCGVVFEKFRF